MNNKSSILSLAPKEIITSGNIKFLANAIVEGVISGLHKSPYHGFSSEFVEYKPYNTGENIKNIDWRKYAKFNKVFVKLFEDETNLYAGILLDKSKSMGFKDCNGISKFEYGKILAASIAWLLVKQRDLISLTLFDNKIEYFSPFSSKKTNLTAIFAKLETTNVSNNTNCAASIYKYSELVKKRGITIIISDLYDEVDNIVKAIKSLCYSKQKVVVVILHARNEFDWKYSGRVKLIDMENEDEILSDSQNAASLLKSSLNKHYSKIFYEFNKAGVDIIRIFTDEPFAKAVVKIIEKRRKQF